MQGRKLVVIDEAQQAPAVFSRLRGTIDADGKHNDRFLLLGSVSPALMTNVAESLAGRLGLVRMTPFILPELSARRLDDLWLRGGYPDGGILAPAMFPDWQAYLPRRPGEPRDLPQWGLPARPQQTLRLLAGAGGVARPNRSTPRRSAPRSSSNTRRCCGTATSWTAPS